MGARLGPQGSGGAGGQVSRDGWVMGGRALDRSAGLIGWGSPTEVEAVCQMVGDSKLSGQVVGGSAMLGVAYRGRELGEGGGCGRKTLGCRPARGVGRIKGGWEIGGGNWAVMGWY